MQIEKPVHKANIEKYQHDDHKAYGCCSLLATDKWNTYIKDPLNENARLAFISKMTNKEKFPENTSPPYEIFYESMTVTVGKIEKGGRWVDQRHLNGYDMIPIIVTILHAKKKNDIIPNVVSDDLNHRMINYNICRCWVRCMHCSDYEARGASGNYEARGGSGNYEAWGARGNYEARGASGGKYEARMVIFCILAAVNRFSWISWKEESG